MLLGSHTVKAPGDSMAGDNGTAANSLGCEHRRENDNRQAFRPPGQRTSSREPSCHGARMFVIDGALSGMAD